MQANELVIVSTYCKESEDSLISKENRNDICK